ncbi:MAG: hypothetical protein NT105_18560 [Verrucomicrobia bacterium]|nr:hypothetical protein [Verrucomicrobiota bacterium]
MKTISRNLLLVAMAWAVGGVTVWAGEKPTKAESAEEAYFIFRNSVKEPGLPTYIKGDFYSRTLALMGEPPLPAFAKTPKLVAYRFTIFPAWGNYFCVRVQEEGQCFRLRATHFVPRICKVAESKEHLLSEADSQRLRGFIERLNFFKMLSEEKPMYVDGESWLIESVAGGKYNVIKESCVSDVPEKRGLLPLYEFCKFLIDNDGLKQRPKHGGYEIFRQ